MERMGKGTGGQVKKAARASWLQSCTRSLWPGIYVQCQSKVTQDPGLCKSPWHHVWNFPWTKPHLGWLLTPTYALWKGPSSLRTEGTRSPQWCTGPHSCRSSTGCTWSHGCSSRLHEPAKASPSRKTEMGKPQALKSLALTNKCSPSQGEEAIPRQ